MDANHILKQVQDIYRDVLDNNSIVLTPETTAMDIDEWDSLSHIELVVALEKHFKIKFSAVEIQSWTNVGAMVKSIENKVNA